MLETEASNSGILRHFTKLKKITVILVTFLKVIHSHADSNAKTVFNLIKDILSYKQIPEYPVFYPRNQSTKKKFI